ncbi:ECF-type sigma factor [Rubrivirga sp.]|uniref:ECF-type sigma factor n=1 Tax=Rubrivirga sp. TaxID=1885344 RepID=UPI003B51EC2F
MPSDALSPAHDARVGAVTAVLAEAADGALSQEDLVARLMPVVYDELREIARAQRRRHGLDGFQTTALVHEAYLRLAGHALVPERAYVFAAAARAMRNVLVDHARRHHAAKRGGGAPPVRLTEAGAGLADADLDALAERVLDVDDALGRLAALDERAAQVVECRYFGGLSFDETAAALGISAATAKRDWRRARAWLHRALAEPDDPATARTAEGEAPPLRSDAA